MSQVIFKPNINYPVPEYPKIQTLWTRSEGGKVFEGDYRECEFSAVNQWLVTEKIDGTNIRIALLPGNDVFIGGRTDNAQLPPTLLTYLLSVFTPEKLVSVLRKPEHDPATTITLYGEGYGPGIQKGGGLYRKNVGFRLFDVRVQNIWLDNLEIPIIAAELGIDTVPIIGIFDTTNAVKQVGNKSLTAEKDGGVGCMQEGIVAKSDPLMLSRMGYRVMWKLKVRDF